MKHDDKFVITRIFNAPKERVFEAWTKPEHIKNWWGPITFTAPHIKIDLRVGGKYVYCMHGTEGVFAGKNFWSGGEFKEIDAPNKIVLTDFFCDEHGNKTDPTVHGLSADFPRESHITVLFEDVKGKTKLSIIYDLPKSQAARDAMKASRMDEGWATSLDKLAKVVEK